MITKITIALALSLGLRGLHANESDWAPLLGSWHIDRVVRQGTVDNVMASATVEFNFYDPGGGLVAGVQSGNSHFVNYVTNGKRLTPACASGCVSTVKSFSTGRIRDDGTMEPIPPAALKFAADDEFLGELFVKNECDWSVDGAHLTLTFFVSDVRVELHRAN